MEILIYLQGRDNYFDWKHTVQLAYLLHVYYTNAKRDQIKVGEDLERFFVGM